MNILNELVELANKANVAGQGSPEMADFRVTANPDTILAIAEAFRALEQCAEAAEAKLAELGASVPVYQYESAIYNEENGDTDWYWDDCDKGFYDQYDPSRRRILFTRPAPAINLAPVSNCLSFFASVIKSGESWSATCQRDLDAARRALRDAEEAK